jgi:hypothetical protein
MEPGRVERMRCLVRGDIDWDALIGMARQHRVVPLVCWNLSTWCFDDLPDDIARGLRVQTRATLARNLGLTGKLFEILNVLEARGISAVPFKGPTLASRLYGDLAFRDFGDLDILVRRREVPAAREALVAMGLSPYRQRFEHDGDRHLRYESASEFLGSNGLVVELHWELTSWRSWVPADPESLWDRLEPVCVAGRTLYTLSENDLLLYLCAHGAKHQWERLQWSCDIAELCQAREWPWAEIFNRAASVRASRLLSIALMLANMLLDLKLPPEVHCRIEADDIARLLAGQCRDRILFQQDHKDRMNQTEFFCATKERLRDKARYFFEKAWASGAER